MLRPFQADSTETLWCLLCCVVLELCRRSNLTGFGGAATRRLTASQGGAHPSSKAEPEVTPPPSSGFGHAALRSANAIQRIPILLDPNRHSFLGYFPLFVLLPTPAHPLHPGHNPVGHSGPLGYWSPLPLVSRCRPPCMVSPSSLLVTSSLTFLSLCAPPGCHGDPM